MCLVQSPQSSQETANPGHISTFLDWCSWLQSFPFLVLLGNKLFDERIFLPLNNLFVYLFIHTEVTQWWRILLPSRRLGFSPWVGKIPWRRKRQPTPIFLPGKSMDGAVGWATVRGVTRVQHNLQLDYYCHRVVYNIIQVYNIVIHNF